MREVDMDREETGGGQPTAGWWPKEALLVVEAGY